MFDVVDDVFELDGRAPLDRGDFPEHHADIVGELRRRETDAVVGSLETLAKDLGGHLCAPMGGVQ
jgi:hypothetical protein